MKSLITILSSILVYSLNASTTIQLHPNHDAALGYHDNFGTANNNYGNAIQGAAYCIPGSSGGVNSNRALIQFDLSSIPSSSLIISAKLNLYATGPLGVLSGHTGSNSSYLERVTSTWNENTVTWNTQPASTSSNAVVLAQSTSSTQDYLNIDVTNLIVDMMNNANNGFLLRLVNETTTNALLFYSRDCGDSTKYPMLEITYGCKSQFTLTPDYDAALGYHDNFGTANNNYGTAIQGAAYCIPGASGGVNSNRALIHFDLSAIPTSSMVVSAKLNLYATGPLGVLSGHTGSNSSYLERVTASWNVNTVTWNTQPTSTSVNAVTLAQSTSATQDYLNIDVTQLVKDMIANTNYGFKLRLINEVTTNALLFYSSDCGDSTKFPRLEIQTNCGEALGLNNLVNIKSDIVSVYPNPASDNITVIVNSQDNYSKSFIIYNSLGEVEYKTSISKMEIINTHFLNNGIYTIEISEGEQLFNKRLVIAR